VSSHRFDGRVAVVTGAGRGLGRSYARLLAELGASVVVNDLGASMQGDGADAGPAEAVAAEIAAAGGAAVADGHDVATVEGADVLVALAIERFGRVDVVVNNAGIIRWAGLPKADVANLEQHLAVHVAGSFNVIRAAWPHFVEQGYGRVVNTTSSGFFGLPRNLGYAAAKGGVIGMTRSLATSGAEHGIKLNCIAPAAYTRMAGQAEDDSAEDDPMAKQMAPELVAPMVAFLAHEECPVSGEIYTAGAGRFARVFVATTPGFVADAEPTVDDVAEHWSAINDEAGYVVPRDLPDWSGGFLSHLG
jgi:NAD(P)-dependent dehydrogenase (short-subunit alcohol dehydrogenase family)